MKTEVQLTVGKKYWLTNDKSVSGVLVRIDEENDPYFDNIKGKCPYIVEDDGTVGFAGQEGFELAE